MEPFSGQGKALPALKSVLRPEVPSWNRREERRPWRMEDQDPEQVAREAIAEIRGALDELYFIRSLLREAKR